MKYKVSKNQQSNESLSHALMDIQVFYDKKSARIEKRLARKWLIACRVAAWLATGVLVACILLYAPSIDAGLSAALVMCISVVVACGILIFEFILPFSAKPKAVFVSHDRRLYCQPYSSDSLTLCHMRLCGFAEYRIAGHTITDYVPDYRDDPLISQLTESLEYADIISIEPLNGAGSGSGFVSAAAMSKVSLVPFNNGYEVEYVSPYYERFGLAPTKVSITNSYTAFDELVALLKGLACL